MTASDATPTHQPARVLDDSAVDELRKGFDGELVRPADAAYATARRAWNGMVDKYPALVVRPRETADVVAAVRFARRHQLEIAGRPPRRAGAGFASDEEVTRHSAAGTSWWRRHRAS